MNIIKSAVALAIAAGFASASFAQGAAPATPAAPAAKMSAPAPAAAEKKAEIAKAATPVKAEGTTPEAKPVKVKHHARKAHKAEAKAETPAPSAK